MPLVSIDYRNVTRVGNIDENSASLFLQLKSFGMCAEFNGTDLLSVRRVNDSDTAASESDVDLLGGTVVASVIGIIFKVDFA